MAYLIALEAAGVALFLGGLWGVLRLQEDRPQRVALALAVVGEMLAFVVATMIGGRI